MSVSIEVMVLLAIYCLVSVYAASVAAFKYCRWYGASEKVAVWIVFLLFWLPILLCRDLDKSIRNFFKDRL